jgi:type II secretory pathway component PulF
MPQYAYIARQLASRSPAEASGIATRPSDRAGTTVHGRLSAPTDSALGEQLREMGLELISFERIYEHHSSARLSLPIFPRLSTPGTNSDEEIPSELSLRLLAEESPSRKDRARLLHAWKRYRSDQDLDAALDFAGPAFPAGLREMLKQLDDGRLATPLLRELMLSRARYRLFRRRLLFQLGTPFLWYLLMLLFVFSAATLIVPKFKEIFGSFGTRLPLLTQLIISVFDFIFIYAPWIILGCVVCGLVVMALCRVLVVGHALRTILYYLPLVGRPLYHLKVATYAEVLALTIPRAVPLDRAALLASAISEDPLLQQATTRWVKRMELGQPPAAAIGRWEALPRSMGSVCDAQMADQGRKDALNLLAASHIVRAIAHLKMGLLSIPQIIVLTCALTVGLGIVAFFLPLFYLFNGLM